ncbi:RNA polymerase, sigma 54 subunit, RpoN/SigL [Bacteroidales bacterium KHT7]|nr:RNA polymerase, sigma 54 subunit, RpoN/SigL [Bacteroidales bacterium KHT7]
MKQGAEIRQGLVQKQTTILSPQQIQFAHLLEIPSAGMEEWVKNAVDENEALCNQNDNDNVPDNYGDTVSEDIKEKDDIVDEYMKDDDGEPLSKGTTGDSEKSSYRSEPDNENSKIDLLVEQMGEYNLTEKESTILRYIIGSLENNGLLLTPLNKLSYELNVEQNINASEDDILDMIETLQEFDPAGVGARSYQESLLIQAQRMHADTAEKESLRKYIIAIFEKMYDDFLHQRWDIIQQRLKIDDETRNKIRQHITHFIPAPLSSEEGLADHGSALAEPDFIIKENSEGEVYVVLNDSHIPQVQLNPEVQREIKYIEEKKDKSKQDKQWLNNKKQKIENARNLIEMLRQRELTLYKTMKAIFDLQKDFFVECDETKLKPMILEDVAKLANLDISTVSRVSNIRFVETLDGQIIPLKYFYSRTYTSNDNESKTIQDVFSAIKEIIDNENTENPYKDEEIVEKLKEKGIVLARRTVAKHRTQLGYPIASVRKNIKR